jgi:hypothetical protein
MPQTLRPPSDARKSANMLGAAIADVRSLDHHAWLCIQAAQLRRRYRGVHNIKIFSSD